MRSLALVTTAALTLLAPLAAQAADVESAAYDVDRSRLVLAGSDLTTIDDVTLTDDEGVETSLTFRLTRERDPRIVAKVPDDTPGTYRLRVYASSTLEDQMDVAVPSVAGAISKGAFVRRTGTQTCLVSKCTLTVACPSGYRAISGGFEKLTFNTALIDIDSSRSVGASQWAIDYRKTNSSTYSISVGAEVLCLAQD